MEITNEIKIIENIDFSLDEVISLYKQEGWCSYTDNPEKLWRAINNSTYIAGAYYCSTLIGIIRCVSDCESIMIVQDIIIKNEYKRIGIGNALLEKANMNFRNVRQVIVLCDKSDDLTSFYKNNGFSSIEDYGLNCFYKENR